MDFPFHQFDDLCTDHLYSEAMAIIDRFGVLYNGEHIFMCMDMKHLTYEPLFESIMDRTQLTQEIADVLVDETCENPCIIGFVLEWKDDNNFIRNAIAAKAGSIVNEESKAIIADYNAPRQLAI
jgi:ABC-type sugar transport system ATPase subunit